MIAALNAADLNFSISLSDTLPRSLPNCSNSQIPVSAIYLELSDLARDILFILSGKSFATDLSDYAPGGGMNKSFLLLHTPTNILSKTIRLFEKLLNLWCV